VATRTVVQTRLEVAWPQGRLAVSTDELVWTSASIAVDSIDARSAVQTRAATSNNINRIHQTTARKPFPALRYIGDGVLFSISFFVYIYVCFFLCFFVSKITSKRLDRFTCNFQGRCGVTMGQPEDILANSEKPRDAAMRNTGRGVVVLSHHSLYWK